MLPSVISSSEIVTDSHFILILATMWSRCQIEVIDFVVNKNINLI